MMERVLLFTLYGYILSFGVTCERAQYGVCLGWLSTFISVLDAGNSGERSDLFVKVGHAALGNGFLTKTGFFLREYDASVTAGALLV